MWKRISKEKWMNVWFCSTDLRICRHFHPPFCKFMAPKLATIFVLAVSIYDFFAMGVIDCRTGQSGESPVCFPQQPPPVATSIQLLPTPTRALACNIYEENRCKTARTRVFCCFLLTSNRKVRFRIKHRNDAGGGGDGYTQASASRNSSKQLELF